MTKWIGRELRRRDDGALGPFLDKAPRPDALFVKAAYASGPDFPGTWQGGFRDGTSLEAVMAVDNHRAVIYADNEDAARGFAAEIYAQQKRMGPSIVAHRHQFIATSRTMAWMWPTLKDIPGRKGVLDRECDLYQAQPADDTPASSNRVTVDLAQRADERIVYDFAAELQIEQIGVDPRKLGRDVYAQRVMDLIAYGRELIAKEKDNGRPYFVGELAALDGATMLLTDAWVPPHYRGRAKLVAQAFWAAARHPSVAGRELFYLAPDAAMGAAAKAAGWKRIAGYRWTVTHG